MPPVKRSRLILWAVVRGLLNAAVLVVLSYVLPLDRPRDCDAAVRLLIGLLVFAGVMVWGVRSIAGSRYPGGAGGRGAGSGPAVVPGAVRPTYFLMERASAASFTQPLTRTDALYFTVTVIHHGGVRGHHRQIRDRRVVLIVQMLADLALLGAGVRVLLGAVQRGRERRPDTGAGPAAT